MRKATWLWITLFVACAVMVAVPAVAQLTIGGHDETSENFPSLWSTVVPTPGATPGGGGPAPHLLISEIVVTPTGGEYIEICNNTADPVDLTNYYLSDDWFTGSTPPSCYCRIVEPGYTVAVSSDFNARFPAGTVINPGQVMVIASSGADFILAYGIPADFELNDTDPGTANMTIVSNNLPLSLALLTNSSEMVVLYFWDGLSDLVCDVDYVQWGSAASGNTVDKSGLAFDGPDADAVASPYNSDTSPALQTYAPSPAFGSSVARAMCDEGPEGTGGNGCTDIQTPTRSSTWGGLKVLYR